MQGRRLLCIGAVATVLVAAVTVSNHEPCPLRLSVVGVEPAGIFDDHGELIILTLSLSVPMSQPSRPEKGLFVRGAQQFIEEKVANRWIRMEGKLWGRTGLVAGLAYETQIAIPAGAVSCRVRLSYTHAILSREKAYWLASRLPNWIPFSHQLHNLLLKSIYTPSGVWRNVTIEVPIPEKALRGVEGADGAQSQPQRNGGRPRGAALANDTGEVQFVLRACL